MLRCLSRYRNAALKIYVEPGEILKEISPELEAQLLRDSPGSFEVYEPKAKAKALDAPPQDRMMRREEATRKESERGRGQVMHRGYMEGLVRPKG